MNRMRRWFVNMGLVGLMAWQVASAEVLYLHSDHLGSMAVGTDSVGAVQQIGHYTPFGEAVIARESFDFAQDRLRNLPTNHLYTSQELDRESNLSYYGARYYDPSLARFYSQDPLFKTGPQKLNPYLYVGGNPCRFTDPSG